MVAWWYSKANKIWLRMLALVVSSVFFFTQIVGASVPDRSFWRERRKSRQKLLSSREKPHQSDRRKGLGKKLEEKDVAGEVSSLITPKNLFTVPSQYGTVKEIHTQASSNKPQGMRNRLIIHIQDAHSSPEAQLNSANILKYLQKGVARESTLPLLICVEGSSGLVDTTLLSSFPEKKVKEEVASEFLKEGKITGEEYFAIVKGEKAPVVNIYGVENKRAYEKNLKAFDQGLSSGERLRNYFQKIRKEINPLKARLYNKRLKGLESKIESYQKKRISLSQYCQYLYRLSHSDVGATLLGRPERQSDRLALSGVNSGATRGVRETTQSPSPASAKYPNFELFVEASKFEKKIDFSRVDSERTKYIKELSEKLTNDELSDLLIMSLDYRLGKVTSGEYYTYLQSLSSRMGKGIRSQDPRILTELVTSKEGKNEYPNLNLYIKYNKLYDKIDQNRLFSEISELEEAVKENLCENEEEKKLVKLSRMLSVLKDLVSLKISNGDLAYYHKHRDEITPGMFSNFINAYSVGATFTAPEITANLSKFEEFYKIALKRNEALVNNTISRMEKEGVKVTVLIAGGFHTPGITELLRDRNISYVVVTPRLGEEHSSDLKLSPRKKRTDLEKAIAGIVGALRPASILREQSFQTYSVIQLNGRTLILYSQFEPAAIERAFEQLRKNWESKLGVRAELREVVENVDFLPVVLTRGRETFALGVARRGKRSLPFVFRYDAVQKKVSEVIFGEDDCRKFLFSGSFDNAREDSSVAFGKLSELWPFLVKDISLPESADSKRTVSMKRTPAEVLGRTSAPSRRTFLNAAFGNIGWWLHRRTGGLNDLIKNLFAEGQDVTKEEEFAGEKSADAIKKRFSEFIGKLQYDDLTIIQKWTLKLREIILGNGIWDKDDFEWKKQYLIDHLSIYYLDSGKNLFWVKGKYAAAHYGRSGINEYVSAGFARRASPDQLFEVATHEALHILGFSHRQATSLTPSFGAKQLMNTLARQNELKLGRWKKEIDRERKRIRDEYLKSRNGLKAAHEVTALIEKIVREVVKQYEIRDSKLDGYCIVFVGSSGRGEMCFQSDIDYMIVHSKGVDTKRIRQLQEMIEDVITKLGFNKMSMFNFGAPNFVLRSSDFSLIDRLALDDLRFVAGSKILFDEFVRKRDDMFEESEKKNPDWIDELMLYVLFIYRRFKEFADFMEKEPNIKLGRGGIREVQNLVQIAKIKYKVNQLNFNEIIKELIEKHGITRDEGLQVIEAYRFLLTLRNAMHWVENSDVDVLSFGLQDRIKSPLGFADREELMQEFRKHARNVRKIVRDLKEKTRKKIDENKGKEWSDKFNEALNEKPGKETTERRYCELAGDKDHLIRLAVAWTTQSKRALRKIMENEQVGKRNWNILFALAHSDYTPPDVLEKILDIENRGNVYRRIVFEVINNKNISKELLERIVRNNKLDPRSIEEAKKRLEKDAFKKLLHVEEARTPRMPVTVVDEKRTDYEGGIWAAKRGEGKKIGKGNYNFGVGSLRDAEIIVNRRASKQVKLTAGLHQYALREVLSRYIRSPGVREATQAMVRRREVGVQFMEDHDALLDVAPVSNDIQDDERRFIRFDTDLAKNFDLRIKPKTQDIEVEDLTYEYKGKKVFVSKEQVLLGLALLSALGQLHEFYHLMGLEERQAIHKTLEFYNLLSEREKKALHSILRSPFIDSGNIFSIFLEAANDSERGRLDFEASFSLTYEDATDEVRKLGNVSRLLEQGKTAKAQDIITAMAKQYSATQKEIGNELEGLEKEAYETDSKLRDLVQRGLAPRPATEEMKLLERKKEVYQARLNKLTTIENLIAAKRIKPALEKVSEMTKAADGTWRWRDKFVSWLIGQNKIDLPYDREAVLEILLDEDMDPDEKRKKVFDVIKVYDRDIELENIERISDEALEEGVELFFARMARASHNQGALVASALRVALEDGFRNKARELREVCRDITDEELRNGLDHLLNVTGEAEEELPSEAMIIGALEMFQEQVRNWHAKTTAAIQKEMIRQASNISAERERYEQSDIEAGLDAELESLNEKVSQINDLVKELYVRLAVAGRKDAAYVIMSQRLHPNESHLQAKMNEFVEPYLGKYPDLLDLVRTGGHKMYCSPDYRWLRRATHWLEAVPLFIRERIVIENGVERTEEVIDYQALEVFFKEWISEHWAYNLRDVMDSEHIALAREVLINSNLKYKQQAEHILKQEPQVKTLEEAIRQVVLKNRLEADVGIIAALIGESYRNLAREVSLYVERKEVSRFEAVRKVIVEGTEMAGSNLLYRTKKLSEDRGFSLVESCRYIISKGHHPKGVKKRLRQEAANLAKRAGKKRRKLPCLHVLTTQGPGMTKALAQGWLEESMALQNVIADYGLGDEVDKKKDEYKRRIRAIGKKIIREHGLWPEVEEVMATQKRSEGEAIEVVIRAYPAELMRGVAELAVLIEYAEQKGRRYNPDNAKDPSIVRKYISRNRDRLTMIATERVLEKNAEEIEPQIKRYQKEHRVGRKEAVRQVIRMNREYQEDLECFILREARRELIRELDKADDSLKLDYRVKTYMRNHMDRLQNGLSTTTAMKEVLAEHKLNHLALNPFYYYESTGGNKRYHLLYTPSRVDLGKRELESILEWDQLIAGDGREAELAGRKLYELYHRRHIRSYPSIAITEINKTAENANFENYVSFSNALSLLINAIMEGDIEEMAYVMSLRKDRIVPPGGEGYGGFCVPKDGLFLDFVLNLSRKDLLRYMGIPDHMHKGVREIVAEARYLRASGQMTDMELEVWAAERLVKLHRNFREYFNVDKDARLILHLDKIVKVFDIIGERDIEEGHRLIENLAARKAIHDMIVQSERNVRFMAFYKVWMTYQALIEAAKRNSHIKIDPASFVVGLMTEYKPDTQDARFSVGMRKLEQYAQTFYHLTAALDEERQALVYLMLFGFHWQPDKQIVTKIAKDLQRRKRVFEHEEISLNEARRMARNKIRTINKQVLALLGTDQKDEQMIAKLEKNFPGFKPPKDIRAISVMDLSTIDHLFYTSDTTLNQIADEVEAKLMRAGLSPTHITANAKTYGPNLRKWAILKGWPKKKLNEFVEGIGGDINALVLRIRGPEKELERALQGLDVLDTGIPHRSFLRLLDDPAKVRDLMLQFNPNSALVIVDGASGGKKRALNKLGVQLWFAVCDQVGRKGVYRSIGVGRNLVERWREEMERHRERAEKLFEAVERDDYKQAKQIYDNIATQVRQEQEAREAIEHEQKLFWLGRVTEKDHCVRMAKSKVTRGLRLEQLDFSTWLAFGGMFLVNGKTPEEIAHYQEAFDSFKKRHSINAQEITESSFSAEEETRVVSALVKPKYVSKREELKEEKKVEISAKAIEIIVAKALAKRREMLRKAEEARAMNERETGFKAAFEEASGRNLSFAKSYRRAMRELKSGEEEVPYRDFGRFLGFTKWALLKLLDEVYPQDNETKTAIKEHINDLYTGREVHPDHWAAMASSYERAGDLSVLGEAVAGKKKMIEKIAEANELFYTTYALSKTLTHSHTDYQDIDPRVFWRDLAVFFAATIHDHFYPYTPWTYYQSLGFDAYRGHKKEMYEMAWERHKWLYDYFRNLILTKTELKDLPIEEQDVLLGNYTQGKEVVAIGNDGDTEEERRWRAYGALREIAFTYNDKMPVTEVFSEFDGEIIDAKHRVNQLLMFPVGRTHQQRILIEGPALARELSEEGGIPCNIIINRYGKFARVGGAKREVMLIEDGHLYLSRDEYVEALVRHKTYPRRKAEEIADQKIDEYIARFITQNKLSPEEARQLIDMRQEIKGIKVAVRFSEPIIAAQVFPFHEHPRYVDGDMERYGLPYSCQSLFHTWTTYNKARYSDIFDKESGVVLPDRIKWLVSQSQGRDEKKVKAEIEKLLLDFTDKHPFIMVKDAAESGGRQMLRFARRPDGKILDDKGEVNAVDFVYWISHSLGHDVAIEEVLFCSPELFMSEQFMQSFVQRQIEEHGTEVIRDRRPRSPLYATVRLILTTDNPPRNLQDFSKVEWHESHPIILASKQLITNIGRGGTLEQLLLEYMQPEQREFFHRRLQEAGKKVMEAMARYAVRAAEEYETETGNKIDEDITGVSYGFPTYLMLDFIPQPVFDKEGNLVDIEPIYRNGKRIGTRIWLENKEGKRVEAKIVDWQMVHIEPNIGIGLWDRYWLRELDRELRLAKDEGRPINWDNVGHSARIVMRDSARRGEEYLKTVMGKDYFQRDGGVRKIEVKRRRPRRGPSLTTNQQLIESALQMTRRRLHMEEDEKIGRDELSVLLKYYVITHLIKDYAGGDFAIEEGQYRALIGLREAYRENIEVANKIRSDIEQILTGDTLTLHGLLLSLPIDIDEELLNSLVRDYEYLERVESLVISQVESAQYAPETKIAARPIRTSRIESRMGGKVNHAVIFEAETNITNELFRLINSAFFDTLLVDGQVVTNVVGVHTSWLTKDGKATRIIYYDRLTGNLVETSLARPMDFPSVQYHSMAWKTHKKLSAQAKQWQKFEVNPYEASQIADSKIKLIKMARSQGLLVPESEFIRKRAKKAQVASSVKSFANKIAGGRRYVYLVVKPDKGTEGEGTEVFRVNIADVNENSPVIKHIISLQKEDDVLIQKLRGNLFYAEGPEEPKRAVDLRLNVSWDGEREYRVSGFAQVAGDGKTLITSVNRGGSIEDYSKVLNNLHVKEGKRWIRVFVSDEDKAIIKETAINFVKQMNLNLELGKSILLAGVDIKLEARKTEDGYRVIPVVLEVNSRPAGLVHSKVILEEDFVSTFNYWKVVQLPLFVIKNWKPRMDEALVELTERDNIEPLKELLRAMILDRELSDRFYTNITVSYFRYLLRSLNRDLRDRVNAMIAEDLPEILVEVVDKNLAVSHKMLFTLVDIYAISHKFIEALERYVDATNNIPLSSKPLKLILQERAILILTDLYPIMSPSRLERDKESEHTKEEIDQNETEDFMTCMKRKLASIKRKKSRELRVRDAGKVYHTRGPMRVGVSSANNSDRHSAAKLEGSKVCNVAVNLVPTGAKEGTKPEPSIYIEAEVIDEPVIQLKGEDNLETKQPKELTITERNIRKFFSSTAKRGNITAENAFNDKEDPLRHLKFAFVFTGIVGFDERPQHYIEHPEQILEDIKRFTGGKGIRLYVRNTGPSKGGFASSSAVMTAILDALYRMSGQENMVPYIYDVDLVAENRLLLRTGWNDTYGIKPGVKDFHTEPTTELPEPIERLLDVDEQSVVDNIWWVDTGITRLATGRLNRRHEVYLSKDQGTYPAILESLSIHDDIVKALEAGDYEELGILFARYIDLRIAIDSGATNTPLQYFFNMLLDKSLIYGGKHIHGGILAGAMGGGVAMLIPTPKGKELVTTPDGRRINRLEQALEDIREYQLPFGERPFDNPRFGRIIYGVNTTGLESWTTDKVERTTGPKGTVRTKPGKSPEDAKKVITLVKSTDIRWPSGERVTPADIEKHNITELVIDDTGGRCVSNLGEFHITKTTDKDGKSYFLMVPGSVQPLGQVDGKSPKDAKEVIIRLAKDLDSGDPKVQRETIGELVKVAKDDPMAIYLILEMVVESFSKLVPLVSVPAIEAIGEAGISTDLAGLILGTIIRRKIGAFIDEKRATREVLSRLRSGPSITLLRKVFEKDEKLWHLAARFESINDAHNIDGSFRAQELNKLIDEIKELAKRDRRVVYLLAEMACAGNLASFRVLAIEALGEVGISTPLIKAVLKEKSGLKETDQQKEARTATRALKQLAEKSITPLIDIFREHEDSTSATAVEEHSKSSDVKDVEAVLKRIEEVDEILGIGKIDVPAEQIAKAMEKPFIPIAGEIADVFVTYLSLLSHIDGNYSKHHDRLFRGTPIYKRIVRSKRPVSEKVFKNLWLRSLRDVTQDEIDRLIFRIPQSLLPDNESELEEWLGYFLANFRMLTMRRDKDTGKLLRLRRYTPAEIRSILIKTEAEEADKVAHRAIDDKQALAHIRKKPEVAELCEALKKAGLDKEAKVIRNAFTHALSITDDVQEPSINPTDSEKAIRHLVKIARQVTGNPDLSITDLLRSGYTKRLTQHWLGYMHPELPFKETRKTIEKTWNAAIFALPTRPSSASPTPDSRTGTFGEDVNFLKKTLGADNVVVLSDKSGKTRVVVVPKYQGRVMTSTSGGPGGLSFGWINQEQIKKMVRGQKDPHINVVGGEDRFWMGPEGGQFSIFFPKGTSPEFKFEDWQTPAVIDTEPFDVVIKSRNSVTFRKQTHLTNYSGKEFKIKIDRTVRLLGLKEVEKKLRLERLPRSLKVVAYESDNGITNTGEKAWTKDTGLLSIWILGMFNPSPDTTIVIPFKPGLREKLGKIVNDAYFGEVPADRLVIGDNVLFFRGDGQHRGKIGLSPGRAKPILGSYDAANKVLTLVQYTKPRGAKYYVNSMWEIQEDPYAGDVVNSYNDGPVKPGGKPLGPFYELETSSPAEELEPNGSIHHVHRTFHLQGSEKDLDKIARQTLGVTLEGIKNAFRGKGSPLQAAKVLIKLRKQGITEVPRKEFIKTYRNEFSKRTVAYEINGLRRVGLIDPDRGIVRLAEEYKDITEEELRKMNEAAQEIIPKGLDRWRLDDIPTKDISVIKEKLASIVRERKILFAVRSFLDGNDPNMSITNLRTLLAQVYDSETLGRIIEGARDYAVHLQSESIWSHLGVGSDEITLEHIEQASRDYKVIKDKLEEVISALTDRIRELRGHKAQSHASPQELVQTTGLPTTPLASLRSIASVIVAVILGWASTGVAKDIVKNIPIEVPEVIAQLGKGTTTEVIYPILAAFGIGFFVGVLVSIIFDAFERRAVAEGKYSIKWPILAIIVGSAVFVVLTGSWTLTHLAGLLFGYPFGSLIMYLIHRHQLKEKQVLDAIVDEFSPDELGHIIEQIKKPTFRGYDLLERLKSILDEKGVRNNLPEKFQRKNKIGGLFMLEKALGESPEDSEKRSRREKTKKYRRERLGKRGLPLVLLGTLVAGGLLSVRDSIMGPISNLSASIGQQSKLGRLIALCVLLMGFPVLIVWAIKRVLNWWANRGKVDSEKTSSEKTDTKGKDKSKKRSFMSILLGGLGIVLFMNSPVFGAVGEIIKSGQQAGLESSLGFPFGLGLWGVLICTVAVIGVSAVYQKVSLAGTGLVEVEQVRLPQVLGLESVWQALVRLFEGGRGFVAAIFRQPSKRAELRMSWLGPREELSQEKIRKIMELARRLLVKEGFYQEKSPEISQLLGWTSLPEQMAGRIEKFARMVRRRYGYERVVVIGEEVRPYAEVAADIARERRGYPGLSILESTHPEAVKEKIEREINLERTLFVVSSAEPVEYLYKKLTELYKARGVPSGEIASQVGKHFVAITETNTPFAKEAGEKKFLRTFNVPEGISGSSAIFSEGALFILALAGVDIKGFVESGKEGMEMCREERPEENLAIRLAAFQEAMRQAGREIVLVLPEELAGFGEVWQGMISPLREEAKQIIVIGEEELAAGRRFGEKTAFIRLKVGKEKESLVIEQLREAGYPVLEITLPGKEAIGALSYVAGFATALSYLMEISPTRKGIESSLVRQDSEEASDSFGAEAALEMMGEPFSKHIKPGVVKYKGTKVFVFDFESLFDIEFVREATPSRMGIELKVKPKSKGVFKVMEKIVKTAEEVGNLAGVKFAFVSSRRDVTREVMEQMLKDYMSAYGLSADVVARVIDNNFIINERELREAGGIVGKPGSRKISTKAVFSLINEKLLLTGRADGNGTEIKVITHNMDRWRKDGKREMMERILWVVLSPAEEGEILSTAAGLVVAIEGKVSKWLREFIKSRYPGEEAERLLSQIQKGNTIILPATPVDEEYLKGIEAQEKAYQIQA